MVIKVMPTLQPRRRSDFSPGTQCARLRRRDGKPTGNDSSSASAKTALGQLQPFLATLSTSALLSSADEIRQLANDRDGPTADLLDRDRSERALPTKSAGDDHEPMRPQSME